VIYLSEATTCAFVQGFLAIRADVKHPQAEDGEDSFGDQ